MRISGYSHFFQQKYLWIRYCTYLLEQLTFFTTKEFVKLTLLWTIGPWSSCLRDICKYVMKFYKKVNFFFNNPYTFFLFFKLFNYRVGIWKETIFPGPHNYIAWLTIGKNVQTFTFTLHTELKNDTNLPNAAFFNCLHLNKLSAYLSNLT